MKATRAESGTADQRRIDAYFTRESQFWKSLYKQANLYGMIHQERHVRRWAGSPSWLCPRRHSSWRSGCGAGLLTAELTGRGYGVTVVDSSEAMVELARGHAAEVGVQEELTISVGMLTACRSRRPPTTW